MRVRVDTQELVEMCSKLRATMSGELITAETERVRIVRLVDSLKIVRLNGGGALVADCSVRVNRREACFLLSSLDEYLILLRDSPEIVLGEVDVEEEDLCNLESWL